MNAPIFDRTCTDHGVTPHGSTLLNVAAEFDALMATISVEFCDVCDEKVHGDECPCFKDGPA